MNGIAVMCTVCAFIDVCTRGIVGLALESWITFAGEVLSIWKTRGVLGAIVVDQVGASIDLVAITRVVSWKIGAVAHPTVGQAFIDIHAFGHVAWDRRIPIQAVALISIE
jgi:hypothetical protein